MVSAKVGICAHLGQKQPVIFLLMQCEIVSKYYYPSVIILFFQSQTEGPARSLFLWSSHNSPYHPRPLSLHTPH